MPKTSHRVVRAGFTLAIIAAIAVFSYAVLHLDILNTRAAANDVILMWDGTTSTIPAGWTCVSCRTTDGASATSTLFNAFPMGSSSFANATSGVDTVNHTLVFLSSTTGASVGHNSNTAGTAFTTATHTHSWGTPTLRPESILPLYKNLIFIKASSPTQLPSGTIAMFDTTSSTLPGGWTYYSTIENRYLRGSNTNTTGGSATAAATTTAALTSGASTGAYTDPGNGLTVAAGVHTHTIPAGSAIIADSNNPSYIGVVFGKATATTTIPGGMLAFFDTAPPTGWTKLSNNGSSWDNRLIIGSSTFGNTGGVTTHNHGGSTTFTSNAATTTAATASGSLANTATSAHTHGVTYSVDTQTSIPTHREMLIGKRNPTVLDQPGFRLFSNQDSLQIGNALAALNTSSTLSNLGDAFRARTLLSAAVTDIPLNQSFKLQWAARGIGSCSAVPSANFSDVQLPGLDWTQATSGASWSARSSITGLGFNNKLWVMGGQLSNGGYLNDVWSSADGATWTQATSSAAWTPRIDYAAVVYQNKMWLFGGKATSTGYRSDVWNSTDGITWTQATSSAAWATRAQARALVYNNEMWLLGGFTSSIGYLNDVWHSADGVNWTQATSSAAWVGRAQFGAVVYNNKMWIMGGEDITASNLNDVWYSTDGITWTQATSGAAWGLTGGLQAITYNNSMWVMSGYIGGADTKIVWNSTDGITWAQATSSPPWAARRYAAISNLNQKIWLFGGTDSSLRYYNDVWSTGGPILFNDNPSVTDESAFTASTSDPTDAGASAIRRQTYVERNPFSNTQSSIAAGEDGMWDFSLEANYDSPTSTPYCLRISQNDNTTITTSTSTRMPEIITANVTQTVSCSTNVSSTSFGPLSVGGINTASPNASTTMTCNGSLGCSLTVQDSNAGLATSTPYTINSGTATLIAGTEGYGIQATSTLVGSGGSLFFNTAYDDFGTANVGGLTTSTITLASSTSAITNREVVVAHKAAIGIATPVGSYSDTITYSCVGN